MSDPTGIVAVCPKCKNFTMIMTTDTDVIRDAADDIVKAIIDGFNIERRTITDDERKKILACHCNEPSMPLPLNFEATSE